MNWIAAMKARVVPTSNLFKGHSGTTVMVTHEPPAPRIPKPTTVYTDGVVRVRCVAPRTPSRRIQAVIKAKLSAQALRSALERAEASYEAAYGKLKGPEITKFTHLTNGS